MTQHPQADFVMKELHGPQQGPQHGPQQGPPHGTRRLIYFGLCALRLNKEKRND